MSLFDDVKKNLIEWYTVTSEKTTEVARVTTRKYDKFGISRDIERQFSELGSLVYNGLREERDGILEEDGVRALVERISQLERELRAKDDEIDRIRREYADRKTTADGAATATTGAAARVMTDPALNPGRAESAILIEPHEEAAAGDDVDADAGEGAEKAD